MKKSTTSHSALLLKSGFDPKWQSFHFIHKRWGSSHGNTSCAEHSLVSSSQLWALIRKLWDEGKMILRLTPEKVKVKQQGNKCWHDASVFYDIFHLYNLFTQVPCSWIDFLVTFLRPWDLAPLVQPWRWSGCPTRGVRVNKHHAQVGCQAPRTSWLPCTTNDRASETIL